jgi:branched-chain amino acid transport system permease protein
VVVAIFVRSPFGAALKGTRDQPRRMNALGYHVWAIRFWACLLSGLLTAVAGICSSTTPSSSARRPPR